MVTYTIMGFLILLGTMCILLAFLLVKKEGQLNSSNKFSPEQLEMYRSEFKNEIDDNAPEMLILLVRYRRLAGAEVLKNLAHSYIESSSMQIRKRVLRVFVELYGVHEPDEDILDEVLENLSKIEKEEQCKKLLDEIQQQSPAHFEILDLLVDIFEIATKNAKKLKEEFNNLLEKDRQALFGNVNKRGDIAQILSELYKLIDILSKKLLDKHTKDRRKRQNVLGNSLKEIQKWVDSCSAFQKPEIADLPESRLIQEFIEKLWNNINDFLTKNGGKSKKLQLNKDVLPEHHNSELPKGFKFSSSQIWLLFLTVFFYTLAASMLLI